MNKIVHGLPHPINGVIYCEPNTAYVLNRSYVDPNIMIGRAPYIPLDLKHWDIEKLKVNIL